MKPQRALALLLLGAAAALEDGLARTPPMGWRSWNCYGGDVDDARIRAAVDALAAKRTSPWTGARLSLADLGFARAGVDDGWQSCGEGYEGSFHAADGTPLVNASRFPDLAALVRYGRGKGLKMGWRGAALQKTRDASRDAPRPRYDDNCICLDSYKLRANASWAALAYAADVEQVYAAGFDGVKIDNCGDDDGSGFAARVRDIKGRPTPVLVENSNQGSGLGPPRGLPTDADWCDFHLFRTGGDIRPDFDGVVARLQRVLPFTNSTPPISRPGCWAYPDMLEVGNFGWALGGPRNGAAFVESRTHFGLWCVVSSPLILSFDVADDAKLEAVWPIVSNEEAIAVNQAWAGFPGTLVVDAPAYQVWAKPLGGATAALVFNRGTETLDVAVPLAALGLPETATARDVWTHTNATVSAAWAATLPPHDSAFAVFSS